MNIEKYRERRRIFFESLPIQREFCIRCLQPTFGCFCAYIRRFDPKMSFAILQHPIELKRRIATGRMAHMCLEGSHLIIGHDYSESIKVNELLANPGTYPVVLYPGKNSMNLTERGSADFFSQIPAGKNPLIFVIDGTWSTARQTMRRSTNLTSIPRICFTPPGPSNFRVRKQPAPGCYSTVEAIHHTIDLLGAGVGFELESRKHDVLLEVFGVMVERQLKFIRAPLRRRTRKESHA